MPNEKFEVGLVFKAFDKVTGPLKEINSRLNAMQAPIRRFNNALVGFAEASGINRISDSFVKVGTAAKNVGHEIFSLGKKFVIFGGIAAAAAGAAISKTVEWASNIHDLSAATGASVESIQGLGYALSQSGGDAETFDAGLKKFTNSLALAKKGTGPLVQVMKKLDPKGLKQILSSKDTGAGLRLFIESLSKAKDDPSRFAAALKVLGKSAAQSFSSLAKDGPAALAEMLSEIPIFNNEQINSTEALGDTYSKVIGKFNRDWMSFVLWSAPALNNALKEISNWLTSHKDQITNWAKDFGEKLPARLKKLKEGFDALWDKLKPVRDFLGWVASDSDRLTNAFIVLGVVMAGPLLAAMVSLTTALGGLSIAILSCPLTWFAAAIGLTAAAFYGMWESIQPVLRILGGMFDDAIKSAENFYSILTGIADFLNGGPFTRFFSGEDKNFDLTKKFKEMTFQIPTGQVDAMKSGYKEAADNAQSNRDSVSSNLGWALSHFLHGKGQASPVAPLPPQQPDSGLKELLTKVKNVQSGGKDEKKTITHNSEITVRFENAPTGLTASVTRNNGNKIKLDLPLGVQSAGRPA
jgi:hypothetical protein